MHPALRSARQKSTDARLPGNRRFRLDRARTKEQVAGILGLQLRANSEIHARLSMIELDRIHAGIRTAEAALIQRQATDHAQQQIGSKMKLKRMKSYPGITIFAERVSFFMKPSDHKS
jgi:hypothetical protein